MRGADGSCAFVSLPVPKPVTVRLEKLLGKQVQAWWYDSRTGEAELIGEFARSGERTFVPKGSGEVDWVLVLGDASEDFPLRVLWLTKGDGRFPQGVSET